MIRTVGGLLSAYNLTKDKRLLSKVKELADILIVNFQEEPNGFFTPLINFKTRQSSEYPGVPPYQRVLSEVGSVQMEFFYLSYLLKDPYFLTFYFFKLFLNYFS